MKPWTNVALLLLALAASPLGAAQEPQEAPEEEPQEAPQNDWFDAYVDPEELGVDPGDIIDPADCAHQVSGATVGYTTDINAVDMLGAMRFARDTTRRAVGWFDPQGIQDIEPYGGLHVYKIVQGYSGTSNWCA